MKKLLKKLYLRIFSGCVFFVRTAHPAMIIIITVPLVVLSLLQIIDFSFRFVEIDEKRYDTLVSWVSKQPELKNYVTSFLNNDGYISFHEYEQIEEKIGNIKADHFKQQIKNM